VCLSAAFIRGPDADALMDNDASVLLRFYDTIKVSHGLSCNVTLDVLLVLRTSLTAGHTDCHVPWPAIVTSEI
jgi:hypothetical protein